MAVKRIGVLAGAFNPVTRAHLALVASAAGYVDETVCVVPRILPHKEFEGASLERRLEMLCHAGEGYRVETTEGGLFLDIARELRARDPAAEIHFICGSDAAERIVAWDYGSPGAINRVLEEFLLLVAARQGTYQPPSHLRHRIRELPLFSGFDEVSSSEVRRRIAAGEPWEHLVPARIVGLVRAIYK